MGADCLEGEGVCPLREQARDGLVIAVEGAEELIPFAVQHGSGRLAQALLNAASGREPGFLGSWITCKVTISALFEKLKGRAGGRQGKVLSMLSGNRETVLCII